LRCSSVARNSFGYQASGTEMVRPSTKATERRSAETATSATRSSAFNAKWSLHPLPDCTELQSAQHRVRLGIERLRPLAPTGRKPMVAGAMSRDAAGNEGSVG